MSELVPEVSDLWESIFTGTKQYILYVGFMKSENLNVVKLFDGDRCTLIEDKVLFSNYKYLGKSKIEINQLFEVDDGREFTGLYDKFGKKIMFGDVVHWTDGGDELSLEERIKTRWDRIAVVRKLYGAEVNFKVIDSPSKKVIEYDMDFDFGGFIYQDTKKYLTVVAESEKEYFDKFKTAGECMKWVLDREV